MTRRTLVIWYTAFAVIAVIVNLGVQRLVLLNGDSGFWFATALLTGTVVGLVVKYLLDRRWIFFDETKGLKAHGRQFTLYTVMGIATTLVFWTIETSFWLVWQTDFARESGGIIGLTIGYLAKYQLDKRFVFRKVAQ